MIPGREVGNRTKCSARGGCGRNELLQTDARQLGIQLSSGLRVWPAPLSTAVGWL